MGQAFENVSTEKRARARAANYDAKEYADILQMRLSEFTRAFLKRSM